MKRFAADLRVLLRAIGFGMGKGQELTDPSVICNSKIAELWFGRLRLVGGSEANQFARLIVKDVKESIIEGTDIAHTA